VSERLTKEYLDGLEMIKSMATPAPDGYGIDAEGTDGGYVTAGNPCDPATKAICHCDTFADATLVCDTLNAAPLLIAAARAQAGGLTEEQQSTLRSAAKGIFVQGSREAVAAAICTIDSLAAENATLKEQLATMEGTLRNFLTGRTDRAESKRPLGAMFVYCEHLEQQLAAKERECERLAEKNHQLEAGDIFIADLAFQIDRVEEHLEGRKLKGDGKWRIDEIVNCMVRMVEINDERRNANIAPAAEGADHRTE
jgi:hypothetical protein